MWYTTYMNSGTYVVRTIKSLTETIHMFVFNWLQLTNSYLNVFKRQKRNTILIEQKFYYKTGSAVQPKLVNKLGQVLSAESQGF